MENQELINALLNDPEVRNLLIKLSKNDKVNAVLSNNQYNNYNYPQNNSPQNYYPQNSCGGYPQNCHDNNFGLGGLGILFLLPLLCGGFGCGCGSGWGSGWGGGCGNSCGCFNNCCNSCCSSCCCCEWW